MTYRCVCQTEVTVNITREVRVARTLELGQTVVCRVRHLHRLSCQTQTSHLKTFLKDKISHEMLNTKTTDMVEVSL